MTLILSKLKKIYIILFTVFLLLIIFFLYSKIVNKNDSEEVQWNSPNDSFTLDFAVGNGGHLFFKGKMNGIIGLLLFDTGAETSLINEKFVSNCKSDSNPVTIIDAKKILQTKNLYKVRFFELGAIKIKELKAFPADSNMWLDPNGIFYNKDSIIGVIGNNIISNFVWDFDMIRKHVTISNSRSYCDSIPDSLAINLISINKHKEIIVQINDKLKRLTLDFGSYFPISLSDSIPNSKKKDKNSSKSQNTKSGLSHLDSIKKESKYDFVKIKIGNYEFEEIQCFENDGSDLLGLPFIWTFKRVIIDFINNKAYMISLNENAGDYGVLKFSRQSIYNTADIIDIVCKPEGMKFVFEKDSIREIYVGYGKLKLYRNDNKLDSIYCFDSIKLPDGKMEYGPLGLKIKF